MTTRMVLRLSHAALALALSGCASKDAVTRIDEQAPVTGRIYVERILPQETRIFTNPTGDGGVFLTSQAGEARRPVTLAPAQVQRLIEKLESALDDWSSYRGKTSLRQPLDSGGIPGSDPALYSVEILKRPDMEEPHVLVTLGFTDTRVEVALDKTNTHRWVRDLKVAAKAN